MSKFRDLSITKKLIFLFILILFLISFSTIFISKIFLPKVYMNQKVKNFETIYTNISDFISGKNSIEKNNSEFFGNISAKNACNVYILKTDEDNSVVLEYPYAIEQSLADEVKNKTLKYYKEGFLSNDIEQRKTYKFEGDEIKEKLSENQNYRIYKVFDKPINSYYLELLGICNDSTVIYLRTNLDPMNESLSLFNNLLIIICLITGFIAIFLIYIMTTSITKPILELSKKTKHIAEFNFDIIEESKRTDEIGILTNSIHFLSNELKVKVKEIKDKNIQLKQDIQQKEEIDVLRKEFISNISHELKTPIGIIQGYAEGLQDSIYEDDEDTKKFYCEVILDETQKMTQLVQKMLTLNKLEFGNALIDCSEFNLSDVINQSLKSMQVLFDEKQIQVESKLIENSKIYSDEFMIEDIITNYLSNACNHCKNEKIIRVEMFETKDDYIVQVFNTGDNIPEESISRIWEKFYKVDKARSRAYGGSGIGLSIVKTIVELLDGECGVENNKNGVTFWFSLKKK